MGHTPTVAGDVLFIGSCNGIFHALNRKTGKVQWEVEVQPKGDKDKRAFHGDPFITEKSIIVGTDVKKGDLFSFDRITGKINWKYPAGLGVGGAVVGFGRSVYAAITGGPLVCLDIGSGSLRWSFGDNLKGFQDPTVMDETIFAGGLDGNVYALDGQTGSVLWKKTLGSPIMTTVIGVESYLYVGTSSGKIYCLRAKDGTVVSSFQLDSKPVGKPLQTGNSLLVYLIDEKGNYHSLVSLDLSLKVEQWRKKVPGHWCTTRLIVWEDSVLVGTHRGEVMALDTRDGSQTWQKKVKGRVRSIGISNDVIYIGTKEGVIYAWVPPEKEVRSDNIPSVSNLIVEYETSY